MCYNVGKRYFMDVTGVGGYYPRTEYAAPAQEVGVRMLDNAIERMDQAGRQLVETLQDANLQPMRFDGLATVVDMWA